MKKSILAILTAGSILFPSMTGLAATQHNLTVTADIGASLSMTVVVKELDTSGNPVGPDVGTAMNFGALVKDGLNAQWGTRAFGVFLTTNTSARRYTVSSTMPSPTSGANTLPNATLLKIIGATKSGADIVNDTFNSSAQAAVMNNQIIYTSSPAGDGAVINLTYGISGANPDGSAPFPGWVGIAPDFPGGDYSSTVSYSLVLL